jgi:hypothetical protein
MDDATKEALRNFIVAVIEGTNLIKSTECKKLSQDPNPEWFNTYDGFVVKMHTNVAREGISGLKIMYKSGEYSFFNLGYGNKPVGYSKAVKEYAHCFQDWTACITWDQAKQFLAKVLADSKEKNKYTS